MPPTSVLARLIASLSDDQRAAATAPPGPVLCVAPAGSGKTTTLVARLGWRLEQGTPPGRICALTFNRRATSILRERLAPILAERGLGPDVVRVRTFHALGREILVKAGRPVTPLLERIAILREESGDRLGPLALRRADDLLARLKLEPRPGPVPPILAAYQAALARAGGLDHDDLVIGALEVLAGQPAVRQAWQQRCGVLLIDEVQDLDHAQWRMARLLAADDDLFAVGDDDQTIYAWRLADARRMLDLAGSLPGLRRVDLRTNYRCRAAVVERAVALVGHNRERLAKSVEARRGATGRLVLVADPADDVARARALLRAWGPELRAPGHPRQASHAILARTNAELAPYAAVALELELPYWGSDRLWLGEGPQADERREPGRRAGAPLPGVDAILAWAARIAPPGHEPAITTVRHGLAAVARRRTQLRRPDAPLLLATIHATKGLEFETVACVGLDDGRFPSERGLREAADPRRALEEERRLAYVAWTRARQALYLVYDPGAASPFMAEAFSAAERRAAATQTALVIPAGRSLTSAAKVLSP